jgi:hypothetical protein
MTWEAIAGLRPGTAHVHPLGDAVTHDVDSDGDCPCGPAVEPEFRADGSNGWVYVHHSLDGREHRERTST